MLMNNSKFLPPVHIHPIVFFFIAVAIITGMFIDLLIIAFIVIIHELGHFYFAKKYNWKVKRIYLWIFGGVMETEESGLRPMKEEWIVTLAGPAQHLFLFFFFYFLGSIEWFPESAVNTAMQYNIFIFLGNLLPIYPLDGGRILHLICDNLFPFQTAHSLTIILSMISIVTFLTCALLIGNTSLSLCLLFGFLFWENRIEWTRRHYKWWKFILYRNSAAAHHYKKKSILKVSKEKRLIDILQKFYRNRYHFIQVIEDKGTVHTDLTETECMDIFFAKKNHRLTVGEIVNREEEVTYV